MYFIVYIEGILCILFRVFILMERAENQSGCLVRICPVDSISGVNFSGIYDLI